MTSELRYLALAGVSTVLALALLHQTLARLLSIPSGWAWGTISPLPFGVAGHAIVFVVAACLSKNLFDKYAFHRRARLLGCAISPPRYPHAGVVGRLLGTDWIRGTMAAIANHSYPELMRARFNQCGHTFVINLLGYPQIYTDDPAIIKAVLATSFDCWPIAGPRLWSARLAVGPKSIFSSNGQDWHRARNLVRPSFVRNQVADMRCFSRHVDSLIEAMRREAGKGMGDGGGTGGNTDKQQRRGTIDMQRLVLAMTMDTSADFMFGQSTNLLGPEGGSERMRTFLSDFDYVSGCGARAAAMGPLSQVIPQKRLSQAIERLRDFSRSYACAGARDDDGFKAEAAREYVFLDQLLRTGADEEYVVDQILGLIIAGRDTTAAALSAVFWFLARKPAAVERLRGEILSMGSDEPTWEQLRNMSYLNNVVKEAMRLCPPIGTNSREAVKETVLPSGGGPDGKSPLLVPKGTSVRWSTYSMHRRVDIWGPDADEFRPERWETADLRVMWEYIPFSGGPRICIGQQFATTLMTYTIYRVLRTFEAIEPRDERPFQIKTSMTASLANGCLIALTEA